MTVSTPNPLKSFMRTVSRHTLWQVVSAINRPWRSWKVFLNTIIPYNASSMTKHNVVSIITFLTFFFNGISP